MDAVNNPEDASMGTRKVPFSRELYIEQDDFREVPPKKYHRLAPRPNPIGRCTLARTPHHLLDYSQPRRSLFGGCVLR